MKGRGLVLQECTRPQAGLSLPTAGHRGRAEGPKQGACGHQVPKHFARRQVLLWGLSTHPIHTSTSQVAKEDKWSPHHTFVDNYINLFLIFR